jgi:hypothetical protein
VTDIGHNRAKGGKGKRGSPDGEGIGGGVYNLEPFDFDVLTRTFKTHASTSQGDLVDLKGEGQG